MYFNNSYIHIMTRTYTTIAWPFMELRVAIKFEDEDHISMTTVSMIPNQEQSSNKGKFFLYMDDGIRMRI